MPADRPPQEPPRIPAPPPGEGATVNEARASEPKSPAPAPTAEPPDRWEAARRWARRLGIAAVLLAAAGMLAVAFVIRRYEVDLPSTQDLKSYHPPQVTRVLAKDGTVIGELFVQRRTLVGIANVPDHVKFAVLAAEDAAFYQHKGLDYLGMLRAIAVNLRSSKARQGGSTITQQVVKNVLLTPERTFDRKMREVILARRIEQELTKDEILELYLNHIYWGHGRYGVEEACRYYFGKSVRETTLAEAALLAGIVKGPSVYSPRVRMDKALARREYVLGQMLAKGFATKEEVEAARAAPVNLAAEVETMSELAPEVVDEVRRTLRALVGPEADQGGYTVTTTIDPALQAAARKSMRGSLDGYLARHKLQAPLAKAKKEPATFEGAPKASFKVYPGIVTGHDDAKRQLLVRVGTLSGAVDLRGPSRYNPKDLLPSQFAPVGKVLRVSLVDPKEVAAQARASDPPGDTTEAVPEDPAAEPTPQRAPAVLPAMRLELGPEGAMVAIDVATRDIVALIGSYEAVRHGLDRATFAKRQPGSTFKAFVYGYAIHTKKLTPATLLETNPAALKGYKPDNYDESEGQSPARVREALAHSVNVAAVNAIDRVGPANVAAFAAELGIESKLGADLSLALGAYEVTPREMAGAYAAFAGGGEYRKPRLISKIVGPGGVELELPAEPPPRRVLHEAESYVVNSLLKSVVEVGTGKRALTLGRPVAGKTGTSNASKDAWFVGYTTDYAVAVWTGFDDASPLGAGETGAIASLPAFVDFMREAHKGKPVRDFPAPPAGIVRVKIDPESGLKAYEGQENAIEELFLAGTEPTEEAQPGAGVDGEPDAGAATEEAPGLQLDLPHEGEPAAPPF